MKKNGHEIAFGLTKKRTKKNIVANAYRANLLLEVLDLFMLAIIFAFIAANVTNGHAITHFF